MGSSCSSTPWEASAQPLDSGATHGPAKSAPPRPHSHLAHTPADVEVAEVARLHQAAGSMMPSSGTAAIATSLLSLLRSGDTLVASGQVYGDTDDLLARHLPALGINVVRVDAFDTAEWERVVESAPAFLAGRADHPVAGAFVDAVMPETRGGMRGLVLEGGGERALQVLRRLQVTLEALVADLRQAMA